MIYQNATILEFVFPVDHRIWCDIMFAFTTDFLFYTIYTNKRSVNDVP
jgi:hypothetical protein